MERNFLTKSAERITVWISGLTLPPETLSHQIVLACRYGAALRRAAVAEFEVRLRVPDDSGAWRLVVSLPTGEGSSR